MIIGGHDKFQLGNKRGWRENGKVGTPVVVTDVSFL